MNKKRYIDLEAAKKDTTKYILNLDPESDEKVIAANIENILESLAVQVEDGVIERNGDTDIMVCKTCQEFCTTGMPLCDKAKKEIGFDAVGDKQ